MMNAARKLKNNKSPGPDNMNPELIKNAPKEVFEGMAAIVNKSIETNSIADVVKKGILVPLHKNVKKENRKKEKYI